MGLVLARYFSLQAMAQPRHESRSNCHDNAELGFLPGMVHEGGTASRVSESQWHRGALD
jgi:hypothetical protein